MRPLLLLCTSVLVGRLAAQMHPCINRWQTTDNTGAYWTAAAGDGTPCDRKSVANTCVGGPNSACTFSPRTFSYRCCHDVWLSGATGLDQAAAEGWSKPLCPYGAMRYGSGSQALKCNITNLATSGCPSTYTCTKSINQPPRPQTTNPQAPVAPIPCAGTLPCDAFLSPDVCCLTTTLTGGMAQAFTTVGLTPTIVPTAPAGTIQDINIITVLFSIHQGDDWSSQRASFTTANTPAGTSTAANAVNAAVPAAAGEIFLQGVSLTAAEAAGTTRFHVLMFDATNTTNILMFNYNLVGVVGAPGTPAAAAAAEILAVPPRITLTPAANVLSVTPVANVQTLNVANYVGPASFTPPYTTKHLIAVLVFKTPVVLANLVPPLVLTATVTGHFQPRSNPTVSGLFTNVTALLKTPQGLALGAPVAGTYFYVRIGFYHKFLSLPT